MEVSKNAEVLFEARYLRRSKTGDLSETVTELFQRVARAVASTETRKKKRVWQGRYFRLMSELRFLPNTPTLVNAGLNGGQLSACYVLPVSEKEGGFFESLRMASRVHGSGGGTGFSFSNFENEVEGPGSHIRLISALKVFDLATDLIVRPGSRRGANMAVLDVQHPKIGDFVELKAREGGVKNFNLSVAMNDRFFEEAYFRPNSSAGRIFDQIAKAAWACGDPGLLFIDRINYFNPNPDAGRILATNPCGEQPLNQFESCNLGSMNLYSYVTRATFDWRRFQEDIGTAVRFLDSVIDVNEYPLRESERVTRRSRKIGLGVMGFADTLIGLGVAYDSREALEFAERVMGLMDRTAKEASISLAKEKGAFPGFGPSIWRSLGYPRLRNSALTTVAPTGTISILAGVSSGIEPHYSEVTVREALEGEERLIEVPASIRSRIPSGELEKLVRSGDSTACRESFLKASSGCWRSASDISASWHVKIQGAFQRHCDSAVSKTVNLPGGASIADVREIFFLAFIEGCKGITVYRDGSNLGQILREKKAGKMTQSDPEEPDVCRRC